jgi:3-mercaptopyruvate sulfurtransferase SseA
MDKRIMKKSLVFLILLVTIFAGAWANAQEVQQSSSLIEPVLLKKWIDNGYRTEKGERVVILDMVRTQADRQTWFAGDAEKLKQAAVQIYGSHSPQYELIGQFDRKGLLGHIPGAILTDAHSGGGVASRRDGPMEVGHQIATGSQIEALLRRLGIMRDDVIVLTSSQLNPWISCMPRFFWTLSYWGFPPEKIKLLNGGNKAYALAGYPLQKGTEEPSVTPSTISVAGLSPKHPDIRVSLGEMISLVDSGKTTNGEMVLLDARQPPAAYYLKDERKANGTPGSDGIPDIYQVTGFIYNEKEKHFMRQADKAVFTLDQMLFLPAANDGASARAPFNPALNPSIPLPNPFLGMHTLHSRPLAIPISPRGMAFDGIIRGARLTKSGIYDITVPSVSRPDSSFKSREELLTLFAKAGIDGTKPIVVYCNIGSIASYYYFILHDICGFKDVRMYDGSWEEWANLTAFEPADTTFVRKNPQTLYPSYPAPVPAVMLFSGRNIYLEWDGKQFVDGDTGKPALPSQIKSGGSLKGNLSWDTLHRSEHIVFRPSAKVNDAEHFQTFNSDTDWPEVDSIPDYDGYGNEILTEDRSYGK